MKDFELFQKHFVKYQKLFGLTGYRCYFKHEPLEGRFADIEINAWDKVATVRLNSALPDSNRLFKDTKRTAKHEALHLLTGKLESLARNRYIDPDEIGEAVEDIAHSLEGLVE